MANPQHIEWLKEGVEAWNARCQSDGFVPDLSRVNIFEELTSIHAGDRSAVPCNLSGIDLRQSDLSSSLWVKVILHDADFSGSALGNSNFLSVDISYANFHKADLTNADLNYSTARQTNFQNANLTLATLGTWDWIDIDLRGAILNGTVFPQTYLNGWDVRGTDLSKAKYLDKRYYESLLGDANTILPSRLPIPASWLSPSTEPPDTALPALPASPIGHTVGSDANTLSLDTPQLAPPKLGEIDQQTLEGLFEDLHDAVDDLQNFGNLDNQAPMLSKGVERFLKRLPKSIDQLDQIRFGTGVQALSLQFTREKPILEDIAP
ncbi:MAG: pentapeptide repeat-containing protein [Pelagimonas sp.]|uniref:pentapeptide repeat-containing protein n=1 Tax=Pelagimonas sp. TaxID=2073170 RepID=UPI003D6B2A7F